jgi:hypothetical protein
MIDITLANVTKLPLKLAILSGNIAILPLILRIQKANQTEIVMTTADFKAQLREGIPAILPPLKNARIISIMRAPPKRHPVSGRKKAGPEKCPSVFPPGAT